jgi:hypothetical protein
MENQTPPKISNNLGLKNMIRYSSLPHSVLEISPQKPVDGRETEVN